MRGIGVVATVVLALGAATAHAQMPTPNWGPLLPASQVPNTAQPHAVKHCRHASIRCIDGLANRLSLQWTWLDRQCDHRAVFSLAYLRITQGLRQAIVAHQLLYPAWMEYVIADFSNHYLQYFDDYAHGRAVPYSWKVTYDEAMHGDANAGQDTLLASNAHTQHDLPYIYAAHGLVTRDGQSRKHDHDAVNAINDSVFRGLEEYYAAHYDPFFNLLVQTPGGLDRISTLEVIQTWREGAWRNAERLVSAKSPAEYHQVQQDIDTNANAWADWIARGDQQGYRATRDDYCRTHRAQQP